LSVHIGISRTDLHASYPLVLRIEPIKLCVLISGLSKDDSADRALGYDIATYLWMAL